MKRTLSNTRPPTASAAKKKVPERTGLASEDAGWTEGEGQQQKAEGDRRRPGRPIEGRGDVLDDAEQHGSEQRAGEAAHAAEHADREDAADVVAAHGGFDRLDHDQE